MNRQAGITRRKFLEAAVGGTAACVIGASARVLPAKSAGPVTRVESVGGVPTFICNGKPVLKPAFETYAPTQHYFRQFADAGTRIFGFSTNAAACDYGHSSTTWINVDTWDHSQFEKRAAAVLAAKPDAMLLPRVNLGTPRWWLEEHPEALERFDDGSTLPTGDNPTLPKDRGFPSLASKEWREAIGDALRRFVKYVQRSKFGPHIFGWCLSGLHTEEFYHWACNTQRLAGYSQPTTGSFRRWLRGKYRTDAALREAWRRNDVALAKVSVPTRAERLHIGEGVFRDALHQNVVDFYLFWNELIPKTIDYFAKIVKEACDHRNVVGAFYGYMYEFAGDAEFGHNALGRYLVSDNLDFIAVTASYFTRQAGSGGDYARSPAASVRLHNKLWYHDNDAVSFLAKTRMEQIGFRENDPDWTRNLGTQLDSLGYTDTPVKSQWMYRRGLGFALCNGMFQAWFDLHGGYFDDPQLMAEIGSLNNLAARAALWDRSSIAEILVISDEKSCARLRPRSQLLRELLLTPQNRLIRMGAPVDHILLEDLPLIDATRYKLIIFLNCLEVTTEERKLIKLKLKCDGKHLLWCSAAGWFSEAAGSSQLCQQLTGFEVIPNESESTPFVLERTVTRKQLASREVDVIREDTWTSIWVPAAALPAMDYRALAKMAGVHIFNDQDDVLYASKSLICLHAEDRGPRILHFPRAVKLWDALKDKPIAISVEEWRQDLELGETRLLHWEQS